MFDLNKERCLRCGGCISVCPKEALELTEQGIIRDEEKCISCGICERFCPVGAIGVKK